MSRNTDPFMPWNSTPDAHDPFAPWNDPMYRDDPFAPWNDPVADARDLDKYMSDNHIRYDYLP